MSKNISLGAKTKSRARLLIAALIDLARSSSPDRLYVRYCQSKSEGINLEWIGKPSVKLVINITIRSLCDFIIDYEKEYSEDQLFLEVSLKASRSPASVIQERVRDVINTLKELNIFEEKKPAKINDKNRTFYLPLISIEKEPNLFWLFDKTECVWDERKDKIKHEYSKEKEDNCSGFLRISDLAKAAEKMKGCQIASYYLPRGKEHIWGRNKFIFDMIKYFSDPDSKCITSLSGPPGYGKTEAAICLGWETIIRGVFDDVLYIRARQSFLLESRVPIDEYSNPLDWESFSQNLSQQLSCSIEQIPKKLRSKKYLIIFDNAETSNYSQIIEAMDQLLNPSYLLMTSRIRSEEHRRIYSKEIGGIDYESAYLPLVKSEANKQNILAILDANEDTLREIYTFSDGAPLAIHFILSRARTEETLDHIVSDLKQANKNVDTFYEFTFKFSWNFVCNESRSLLLYLSLFDHSVSEDEVKSSLKINDADFRRLKRELRLVYLVQANKISGQFRLDLHPWIRTAIRGKRPENWSRPSLGEIQNIIKAKFGDQ